MLYKMFGSLTIAMLCSSGYAAACVGADPAVVSVVVKGTTADAVLNHYQITGVVTNKGTENQPSNTLQSVDIFGPGTQKLDAKSIPPLKAGESFTFMYQADRALDAGNGSSKLTFTMDVQNITSREQNCDLTNDSFTLTF